MILFSRRVFSQSLLYLLLVQYLTTIGAFLKSIRIEEIPFGLTQEDEVPQNNNKLNRGIHAVAGIEQTRSFVHLFHVPYIICFFAAKGKWPFIPPMMQSRVDAASKTLFAHNDSFIQQFCRKYIQIKECFRPLFATATPATVDGLSKVRGTPCTCAPENPVVYFDRDHIGGVSSDTILDTIEFLESFLPAPTKKPKRRKNRVRGRVDEMDVQ